jgi:hypothetical protein
MEIDGIYAAFDPYGNSGLPLKEDNWIIKADNIIIMAITF